MNKYKEISKGGRGNRVRKLEHVLIAETALGHELPEAAEVHHVDGNGRNNLHTNLVVCENHAYHALLHKRTVAYYSCGHADWLKCKFCKIWGTDVKLSTNGRASYHPNCKREWHQAWANKTGRNSQYYRLQKRLEAGLIQTN